MRERKSRVILRWKKKKEKENKDYVRKKVCERMKERLVKKERLGKKKGTMIGRKERKFGGGRYYKWKSV